MIFSWRATSTILFGADNPPAIPGDSHPIRKGYDDGEPDRSMAGASARTVAGRMRATGSTILLVAALFIGLATPAIAQMTPWDPRTVPEPTSDRCGLADSVFFENAVERMRRPNGPNPWPPSNGRMTFDGSLPRVRIGQHFFSYPSAAAYLEAHPDCCRLTRPDPQAWQDAFGDWPMRSLGMRPRWMTPDNTVEVQVRIQTMVEAEGKKALFGAYYYVLLDRCAQRFEMFVLDGRLDRVDVRSSMTSKIGQELQP